MPYADSVLSAVAGSVVRCLPVVEGSAVDDAAAGNVDGGPVLPDLAGVDGGVPGASVVKGPTAVLLPVVVAGVVSAANAGDGPLAGCRLLEVTVLGAALTAALCFSLARRLAGGCMSRSPSRRLDDDEGRASFLRGCSPSRSYLCLWDFPIYNIYRG